MYWQEYCSTLGRTTPVQNVWSTVKNMQTGNNSSCCKVNSNSFIKCSWLSWKQWRMIVLRCLFSIEMEQKECMQSWTWAVYTCVYLCCLWAEKTKRWKCPVYHKPASPVTAIHFFTRKCHHQASTAVSSINSVNELWVVWMGKCRDAGQTIWSNPQWE